MNTNRISYVDDNDSSYTSGKQTSIIGYTVLKAPRGVTIPYKFPKGAEAQIKARIGTPSKDYPDIQEAIEYNRNYSLYISAPPGVKIGESNYYGGVYLTTVGSVESFYKVTDPETPNFDAFLTACSSASAFTKDQARTYTSNQYTIDNIPVEVFDFEKISSIIFSYPTGLGTPTGGMTSVALKISGTNIVTDEETPKDVGDIVVGSSFFKMVFAGNVAVPNLDLTEGSALDLYLDTPANINNIVITYVMNIEDYVIQTLYQNSPRSTSTSFSIKKVDISPTIGVGSDPNPFFNTITFSFSETSNGTVEYTSPNIVCSPDVSAVDGYNQSLYVEDVLSGKNLWYIGSKVYKNFNDSTKTWTTPINKTVSGVRVVEDATFTDSTDLAGTLALGWSEATDPQYEEVVMFFDNSGEDAVKTTMASLRNGLHKTATFVSPIKVTSSDTDTAVSAIVAKRATCPSTFGLAYICNEFLIKDPQGKEYYSSIVGSVALDYSLIIEKKYGGVAPMYTNDGNNLGGQLSRTVKKAKYKFTADHLDTLDEAGVNPIILDNYYGLMLTSQRSAANPLVLTDWSYLGHSMAFDLLKRELKKEVLIPQIGKAISPFYLDLRQRATENILSKRLTGDDAIWTAGEVLVNDESVNNDETKSENKFWVKVRVKVTPFSEWVVLVLNNVAQTTNL